MTAEQLLREPAGPRSEPPRSLSNTALMASLRPPPDYGNSPALRRSMEPHLLEGVSWFLDRTPWQRVLLSTGLGALVGVGIVVTLARLFAPELGTATARAAVGQQAALAAPAAAALLAPAAATPVAPVVAGPLAAPTPLTAQPDDAAPAEAVANVAAPPETKPATGKAARKAKAAKRSKKAKQRARKPTSLPARWSELYARER